MASTMPTLCIEKQWLFAEFTVAASDYLQAQTEYLKAVALGDDRFEAKIIAAAKRKEEAKCAIVKHQTEHGC